MLTNLMIPKGDEITMPFSPGEAAKTMAGFAGGRLYGLHRINFPRNYDYQEDDGPDGITAYDHLFITVKFKGVMMYLIVVDTGTSLMPVVTLVIQDGAKEVNMMIKTDANPWLKKYDQEWFENFFNEQVKPDLENVDSLIEKNPFKTDGGKM